MSNADWLERLKKIEVADATYWPEVAPFVFSRALGSHVYDAEGREYIDLCAGFGALALGHRPPELQVALAEDSIDHGLGDVYASTDKVRLLEELVGSLPPRFTRAGVALSGSQAIEFAIKTAVLATGRAGFIALEDGYHGVDIGVLGLAGREDFRAPFSPLLSSVTVERVPINSSRAAIDEAAARLAARGAALAGIVAEPVLGRGGGRPLQPEYLNHLADVAHSHGALFILDEVLTGFGRCGRWSFSEVVPCDLVCFGKALGGGWPLSAVVGTEAAMNAWPESRGEALHTGTFFGHPFSCRVGLAGLQAIKEQGLVQRAVWLGERWRETWSERWRAHPLVADVRVMGLMIAIEFKERGRGAALMDAARVQGVIALASGAEGECLSLTPALNIREDLLDAATNKLLACLD